MVRWQGFSRLTLSASPALSCTVTVYLSGTNTLATLYAANDLTQAKANPFTAGTDGFGFFYAGDGLYDIQFSGGGITSPWTLGAVQLLDASNFLLGTVNVLNYGAIGNGVADDTAAIATAYAALPASGGRLVFPSGIYKTTGVLTPRTGVTFQGNGIGATLINYSGVGFWLDLGATALCNNVGWESMSVSCLGSSLGALRVGRTSQGYDAALFRVGWHLRDLYLSTPNTPMNVGGIGISATQYIDWTLDNVTVNSFERPWIFDRGGNSVGTRVRAQGFKFGPKWTNNIGGCQDTYLSPEFLGPTTTGATPGVDYGYTCEIDANFVTFVSALYESMPAAKSQGYLHITTLGAEFVDVNGTFSAGVVPDNTIVCDNTYYHPKFYGTYCPPGQLAISFGTAAKRAEFISCSSDLNVLVAAQSPTKYTLIGATTESAYSLVATGIGMKDLLRADFGQTISVDGERGIYWHSGALQGGYGIGREAGAWVDPYKPLFLSWQTGIKLDPGASSTKSYVEIVGPLELTRAGSYVGLLQSTAPAAPASGARLYSDTSGGKNRLLVRFPTGAAIVLATEV